MWVHVTKKVPALQQL